MSFACVPCLLWSLGVSQLVGLRAVRCVVGVHFCGCSVVLLSLLEEPGCWFWEWGSACLSLGVLALLLLFHTARVLYHNAPARALPLSYVRAAIICRRPGCRGLSGCKCCTRAFSFVCVCVVLRGVFVL